jgi:hypothetical protein
MPTLAEQLNQLAQHEQRQENLANAIEKLVSQPRIFNMLKKALVNKFSAKIPYQRFDDEGFVNLKPKETSQVSSYNSYEFTINVEPRKKALEVRITFDGKIVNVIVIDYLTHLLDQDTVINLLKQVIGIENKVK